jgi:hypothetical protein
MKSYGTHCIVGVRKIAYNRIVVSIFPRELAYANRNFTIERHLRTGKCPQK